MSVNPVMAQKFLKGVDYPASKQDLMRSAQEEGADERTIQTLQRLPDRRYEGPQAVAKAIGEIE
jgi:hypothetical protein